MMTPSLSEIHNRQQRHDAQVSSRFPLSKPDQCPEDALNRILWHAQRGFNDPYPSWAITETNDD